MSNFSLDANLMFFYTKSTQYQSDFFFQSWLLMVHIWITYYIYIGSLWLTHIFCKYMTIHTYILYCLTMLLTWFSVLQKLLCTSAYSEAMPHTQNTVTDMSVLHFLFMLGQKLQNTTFGTAYIKALGVFISAINFDIWLLLHYIYIYTHTGSTKHNTMENPI